MHPAQKHARTTSHTPTATLMTHLPSQHDFSLHGAAARMGDHGRANSSTGKREQVMSWHGLHNHAEGLFGTASRACAALDHPPNALASHDVLVVASISALLMTFYTLPTPCAVAANRSQTRVASPMNTSVRSRCFVSCSSCHRPAKIPRPYPHVLHSQPLAPPYACLQVLSHRLSGDNMLCNSDDEYVHRLTLCPPPCPRTLAAAFAPRSMTPCP